MLVLGFAVLWFGYDVTSWGYCLIRGWNITFIEWSNPLHPYQWPKDGSDPPKIPQGKTWPTGHPAWWQKAQTGPNATSDQALMNDVQGGTP